MRLVIEYTTTFPSFFAASISSEDAAKTKDGASNKNNTKSFNLISYLLMVFISVMRENPCRSHTI
jgi:hypothetical protein